MTPNGLRFACAVTLPLLVGGTALAAAPEGLKLSNGPVRTDAAGAFVSVAVQNTTQTEFGKVVVSCTFTRGGKSALGTSSTTLFSVVGGTTGNDQVRLLGATAAKAVSCEITSAQ